MRDFWKKLDKRMFLLSSFSNKLLNKINLDFNRTVIFRGYMKNLTSYRISMGSYSVRNNQFYIVNNIKSFNNYFRDLIRRIIEKWTVIKTWRIRIMFPVITRGSAKKEHIARTEEHFFNWPISLYQKIIRKTEQDA